MGGTGVYGAFRLLLRRFGEVLEGGLSLGLLHSSSGVDFALSNFQVLRFHHGCSNRVSFL
uniref:Uncharacterized protein n=1 Tax=Anguilla anguilla TaxID=7936 RepID=A0A0E9WSV9_ANGAN